MLSHKISGSATPTPTLAPTIEEVCYCPSDATASPTTTSNSKSKSSSSKSSSSNSTSSKSSTSKSPSSKSSTQNKSSDKSTRRRRLKSSGKSSAKSSSAGSGGVGNCDCDEGLGLTQLRFIYQGIETYVTVKIFRDSSKSILVCEFLNVNPNDEVVCDISSVTGYTNFDDDTPFVLTTQADDEICEAVFHTHCGHHDNEDFEPGTVESGCPDLILSGWQDGGSNDCDDGQEICACTDSPTESPSLYPTESPIPTEDPTKNPTDSPTKNPTDSPTKNPTDLVLDCVSVFPTATPAWCRRIVPLVGAPVRHHQHHDQLQGQPPKHQQKIQPNHQQKIQPN